MSRLLIRHFLLPMVLTILSLSAQAEETYSFGVLPQRSPLLTAQYWNPILDWVSHRSGVNLDIKIAQSGGQSGDAVRRGEYDFVYSNHQFKPTAAAQGYTVILRRNAPDIMGALVVLDSSPIQSARDLEGKTVAFANPHGFTGFTVQMDYLAQQGIQVTQSFGGNQEGALKQMIIGSAAAAGVNSSILAGYETREKVRFRVVWQSKPYRDLAISAHSRVPNSVVEAVRLAFLELNEDAEGVKILEASERLVGESTSIRFLRASQQDCQDYLEFYRHNVFHDAD
ncbi:MAG: phosphate/phosphite/phosphonate ABC transporter substrate-binding protein [Magnetococcus sp. YQC-9]